MCGLKENIYRFSHCFLMEKKHVFDVINSSFINKKVKDLKPLLIKSSQVLYYVGIIYVYTHKIKYIYNF